MALGKICLICGRATGKAGDRHEPAGQPVTIQQRAGHVKIVSVAVVKDWQNTWTTDRPTPGGQIFRKFLLANRGIAGSQSGKLAVEHIGVRGRGQMIVHHTDHRRLYCSFCKRKLEKRYRKPASINRASARGFNPYSAPYR